MKDMWRKEGLILKPFVITVRGIIHIHWHNTPFCYKILFHWRHATVVVLHSWQISKYMCTGNQGEIVKNKEEEEQQQQQQQQ